MGARLWFSFGIKFLARVMDLLLPMISGAGVCLSILRDAYQRGFLWRNVVFDAVTPVGYVGEARGINNLTQIVGHVYHGVTPHAFYRDARNPWWLLDSSYSGPEPGRNCVVGSIARAITDSGVIVGDQLSDCSPPSNYFWPRAARWPSAWSPWGDVLDLAWAPGSRSLNINNSGTIVGRGTVGNSLAGGFRLLQGVAEGINPPEVNTAHPFSVWPYGVNDGQRVVGSISLTFDGPGDWIRAFTWNVPGEHSTLLPVLADGGESVAFEINNDEFSVGYSDNYHRYAVIWHSDFGIYVLPMPPGAGTGGQINMKTCKALAVNNRNASGLVQAVGYCVVNGNNHAMLWNIMTDQVTVL